MTIIAYRDGVLAADSLSTNQGTKLGAMKKIWRTSKGRIAICGDYGDALKAARWIERGMVGSPPSSNDPADPGAAIWLPDRGDPLIVENGTVQDLDEAPYHAWGSGARIALGAMHQGASAEEAVEAAIAHCVICGGPVQALEPRRKRR